MNKLIRKLLITITVFFIVLGAVSIRANAEENGSGEPGVAEVEETPKEEPDKEEQTEVPAEEVRGGDDTPRDSNELTINARIIDRTDTAIDFSGSSDLAQVSNYGLNPATYEVYVKVDHLSGIAGNTITFETTDGLLVTYDSITDPVQVDEQLKLYLTEPYATHEQRVISLPGPHSQNGETNGKGGSKVTYYVKEGTTFVPEFLVKVTVNKRVATDYIDNAIKITVNDGSNVVTSVLEKVETISHYKFSKVPSANPVITAPNVTEMTNATKTERLPGLPDNYRSGRHLAIEKATYTITLSDPNATFIMNSIMGGRVQNLGGGVYKLEVENFDAYFGTDRPLSSPLCYSIGMSTDYFNEGDEVLVSIDYEVIYYNDQENNKLVARNESGSPYQATWKLQIKDLLAFDINYPITSTAEAYDLQAQVGFFGVTNYNAPETGPKTIEMHFDPVNIGVRSIKPWVNGGDGVVTFTTAKNPEEQTVTISKMSSSSQVVVLYPSDLRLAADDYLTSLKYNVASIDQTMYSLRSPEWADTFTPGQHVEMFSFSGYVFNDAATSDSTIEIYDKDTDHENSTGVAHCYGYLYPSYCLKLAEKYNSIVSAGNELEVAFTYSNSGNETDALIYHPVYYYVVTTVDGSGNYLTMKDFSVRSINVDDIVETYVVEGVGRVYKIDTSKYTDAEFVDGHQSWSCYMIKASDNITFSTFMPTPTVKGTLVVPLGTPGQSQDYSTMFYVEDGDRSTAQALYIRENSSNYASGDPYGVSNRTAPDGNQYLIGHYVQSGSYTINPVLDVTVATSGKNHDSDEYIVWNEGDDPIAIGNKSTFDIKVDFIQTSGEFLSGESVIYIPIPKVGDDWGTMLHNGEQFEFDVKLNNITPENMAVGFEDVTIEYANVTPSDDYDTLEGYSFNSAYTAGDNLIKITLKNIPANAGGAADTYSFVLNCSTDNATTEGLIDTWRPMVKKSLAGTIWSYGSYISLEIALGEVRGQLFLDANGNGKLDSGEELALADVELEIFDDSGNSIATTKTDSNGKYSFVDIKSQAEYTIKVTNPDATTYEFTVLGTKNQKDNYNTDNQFVAESGNAKGKAEPVYPALAPETGETPATYNVGLFAGTTTITFNANGGKFADDSTVKEFTGRPSEALSAPTPEEREGYTFKYWYLSTDTTQSEATIPSTLGYEDLTFMAKWELKEYTITYGGLDGTTNNPDNPSTYTIEDGTITLLDPADKDGYEFSGWVDEDGNPVTTIPEGSTGDITVTATWTLVEYPIIYNGLEGTTNHPDNPSSYTIESDDIVLKDPADKEGYTFAGWTSDGQPATGIPSGSTGKIIFTATWTPIEYTITYEGLEGTTNNPANPSTYTIESGEITLQDPADKEGYTFAGWEDEDGDPITTIPSGSTGDVTVTATWDPIPYTITYEGLEGTTNNPDNPSTYTIEDGTITLQAPNDKEGYIFAGWVDEDGNPITTIPSGSTGDITVTATWTPRIVNINYDNGSQNVSFDSADYDSDYEIHSSAAVVVLNADLLGWSTDPEATEPEFADGDEVVLNMANFPTMVESQDNPGQYDLVLYAVTVPFKYECVSGDGSTYMKSSNSQLAFVFERSRRDEISFDQFSLADAIIEIDGEMIQIGEDCTAQSGSLDVFLLPAYLESLTVGEHEIAVYFKDYTNPDLIPLPVTAKFYVKQKPADDVPYVIPKTGV